MKAALVTGANRGLGLGLAETLASRGYVVYAGMRSPHNFSHTNTQIRPIELNVQDDASIQRAAETIRIEVENLDLLVNNAGLNKDTATGGHKELVTALDNIDRSAMLRMFDINAVGPLVVCRYMVPLMTGERCFVINISSQRASFSDVNSNGNYGYRASKVALNMLTKSLVHDLPANVRTFAVHPGSVLTDMNLAGNISPVEAAAKIMGILDHWQPSMNGAFLANDGSEYPL